MRRDGLLAALAAIGLICQGAPASADVRYDFTAFSSFPFGDDGETYSGDFSFIAPGFITTDTTAPVADLTSCSVTGSTNPASCDDQHFNIINEPGFHFDQVGFGLTSPQFTGQIFYYFEDGAFSHAGSYDSQILGSEQAGRLVVTDLGGHGGGVPEPAQWALLLAGFGLAGAALRVRRSSRRAIPAHA
jgi:hypothetical protein